MMKWHYAAIILIGLCVSSAMAAEPGSGLSLASDGETQYVIALAQDAIPAEKTAAEQLQTYLEQVTGATFAIEPAVEVGADAPQILVGAGERVRNLLAEQDWDALGGDGIVIKAVGDKLILAGGRPRGTLYAVFQFLEQQVGCRWWTPEASTIPHRPTLILPIKTVVYRPPFRYREHSSYGLRKFPVFSTIMRENGHHQDQTKAWGGHHRILGFAHTFRTLLPPKEYFAEHPEWYTNPLNGDLPCTASSPMPAHGTWQLCVTNPEVVDALTKAALQWIEDKPKATYISISQCDNNHYCKCDRCMRIIEEQGAASGPLLKFVNEVAGRIHAQYPEMKVVTLAYRYSIKPPKTLTPAKNVVIQMAPINADFGHPIDSDWNKEFRDIFLQWSDISSSMFIWNYVTNFSYPLFPHPNWAGLAEDLRFYADHHVNAIYQGGDRMTGGVGKFVELRQWVIGHLMWNPTLSQDKLIDEFMRGYYGPASPYLGQYLDLVHQSFLAQQRKMKTGSSDFSYITLDVANEAIHLFEQAAEAVKKDPELASRVRQAKLSLDGVILYRYKALSRKAKQTGKPFAGPSDPRAALEQFERMGNEYGVRNFSLQQSFDEGIAYLSQMLQGSDVPLPEFARKYAPEAVIDIQPNMMHLSQEGTLTHIVEDAQASGGKAAMLEGHTKAWGIMYRMGHNMAKQNQPWHVYVMVRLDAAPGTPTTGAGFGVGIYDYGQAKYVVQTTVPMAKVSGEQYHRIDLGTHRLRSGMAVYFAPLDKDSVEKVFVDRIILIRADH